MGITSRGRYNLLQRLCNELTQGTIAAHWQEPVHRPQYAWKPALKGVNLHAVQLDMHDKHLVL